MNVRVRFFALARDIAGQEAIELELPSGATVAELRSALMGRYPALETALRLCMVARNASYAAEGASLAEGDEVAIIPPVSGG